MFGLESHIEPTLMLLGSFLNMYAPPFVVEPLTEGVTELLLAFSLGIPNSYRLMREQASVSSAYTGEQINSSEAPSNKHTHQMPRAHRRLLPFFCARSPGPAGPSPRRRHPGWSCCPLAEAPRLGLLPPEEAPRLGLLPPRGGAQAGAIRQAWDTLIDKAREPTF
jgi:hypothetical protein